MGYKKRSFREKLFTILQAEYGLEVTLDLITIVEKTISESVQEK